MHTIRVWDLPTRLFHWALAACVVGLIITGNVGGNWMVWHGRLGYAVLALLLFRVLWGFVGGHWSRFATFVRRPSTVLAYVRGRWQDAALVGHNPLGALSVLALLLILLAQVGSGLFSDDEIAFTGPLAGLVSADWIGFATSYHKRVGKLILLALIGLHLAAIAFYRLARQQDLVRPMLLGDKDVPEILPASRDTAGTRLLALLLLLLCTAAVYWIVSLGDGAVAPSSFD